MDEEELQEIEKMMKGLRDEAELRGGDAYWMYGSFAPDVRRLIRALRETRAVPPEERAKIIQECRTAVLETGQQAHEAAKAKDATDYIAGYQDCAVDADEALRDLLTPSPQSDRP